METLMKEKRVSWMAYFFRGLAHCHYGATWCAGRHGPGEGTEL